MIHTVDSEGLQRLVKLELDRMHPSDRKVAREALVGRMGAYDNSHLAIDAGLDTYFEAR
jgi:hypothetical protein